jgi:hypothetical protein
VVEGLVVGVIAVGVVDDDVVEEVVQQDPLVVVHIDVAFVEVLLVIHMVNLKVTFDSLDLVNVDDVVDGYGIVAAVENVEIHLHLPTMDLKSFRIAVAECGL